MIRRSYHKLQQANNLSNLLVGSALHMIIVIDIVYM